MSRLARRVRFRFGIASILTASMVLVVAILMAVTTLLDIRRANIIFQEGLEQRGLLLASTLNDILADPLYFIDVDELTDIAAIVSGQPDILYVQVMGPDGGVLVDTRQGKYPSGRVQDDRVLRAVQGREVVIRVDGAQLELTAPVQIGTQLVGGVRMAFSRESLGENISALRIERLGQSAVLTVVAVVLALPGGPVLRPADQAARKGDATDCGGQLRSGPGAA